MNITFLVGNGFDLGLGIKSSFKHFFQEYVNNSMNKEPRIKQLSESIGKDYETWADFEVALGQYTLKFNSSSKHDFIDQVKDFEMEFIEYLKSQEAQLSFYDTDTISRKIINALTQYYSFDVLPAESSNVIRGVYVKGSNDRHIYNFINFNYTYLLENVLKTVSENVICRRKNGSGDERVDKIGNVIHVHGHCDGHPIIGVNDSSQLANQELAEDPKFTRYIVKPSMNSYLRHGYDKEATDMIWGSTIICVYGMSLGATDKKWWNMLLLWLKQSNNRQLVLFVHDENYSSTTPYDWLEKEDSIFDRLSQYSSNKGAIVEQLRDRIHIAINKDIFEMNLQQTILDKYRSFIEELDTESIPQKNLRFNTTELTNIQHQAFKTYVSKK